MKWRKIQNCDGYFQFINEDNKRNGQFFFANEYKNGNALVKCMGEKYFRYRDLDGILSEEFEQAGDYNQGFAMVLVDNKLKYRDIAGNLTDEKTKLGGDLLSYLDGKISALEVPNEDYMNENFYNYVINTELRGAKEAVKLGIDEKEIADALEYTFEKVDNKRASAFIAENRKEELCL